MDKKQCKICKRAKPETRLTHSLVQNDIICVDCYINQFPAISSQTIPVFL
jgi:hypothetical protein